MQDNIDFFEFEDRNYVPTTTSRDSQLDFIDTLRETMGQKQNEVNASTYALGSQLPSRFGGLSGGEQTFEARYRTPQLEQTAANLRTAAQQTALNQALSNLQSAWKKRYNDAVLNYQRRAASSGDNGGKTDGDAEIKGTSEDNPYELDTPSVGSDQLDQPITVVPDLFGGGSYIYTNDGQVISKPSVVQQVTPPTERQVPELEKFFRFIFGA